MTTLTVSSFNAAPAPREIIYQVIGELDKESLAACTLVSRHWHNPAHHSLFRRIVVVDSSTHADKAYGLAAFDDLIHTSRGFADVAQHVFELCIKGTGVQYVNHDPKDKEYCSISVAQLDRILTRLPVLDTLRLVCVNLHPSITCPLSAPKSLEKLHLDIVKFERTEWERTGASAGPPTSAFTQLLKRFGRVKTLHMGPWQLFLGNLRPESENLAADLPEELLIENIIAQADPDNVCSLGNVLLPLAHSRNIHALQVLDIHDDTDFINRVLSQIGHHLPHLRLHMDWEEYDWELEDPFGLSACTALHTLHIDIWTPSETAWDRDLENPCLRKIILHLHPSVKQLTIRLKRLQYFSDKMTWSTQYIDGLDWESIDSALIGRPSLEQLGFELFCDKYTGEAPTFEDEIKAIQDKLPKLVRKGIVDVTAKVVAPESFVASSH
ncbi:hypothetical protein EIP91_009408 [Steccherinum ochraceum]|uniref:F-box domain-containing protein n=1 Tax=Steccherinum ochraceum TaxID=92696 RepID=A0A4R0REI1_9APHY|nr:hypothetical protein EIP91_009408 [Steccherinum ochraceum]